jgi:hypothetical protein
MLDNRPALVVPREGPVLLAYSGDGRLSRNEDVVTNALNVAALVPTPGHAEAPDLAGAGAGGGDATGGVTFAEAVHPNETADVARLRAHRIEAGG